MPRRRGAGEAGGRAAAPLQRRVVPDLLSGRRGAQGALQGGGGAAGARRRAEERPAAVLHQLRQTGQEVRVAGAAGTDPQPPPPVGGWAEQRNLNTFFDLFSSPCV